MNDTELKRLSVFMVEQQKQKKNCDNSCPIFRNDQQCTYQCETVEYWQDRLRKITGGE